MSSDSSEQEFDQAARLIGQRQVWRRRPKTTGRMIPQILARTGIASQQASQETNTAWQQAAGSEWIGCTQAGSVKRGHLEVTVNDSMVLQQLVFQQSALLTKLQELMPSARLKGIRFRVDPSQFSS